MQDSKTDDYEHKGTTGQQTSADTDDVRTADSSNDDTGDEFLDEPTASDGSTSDDDLAASRSDDPGQSSYGGFNNEGPADGKNHAADADAGSSVGGMATGSSNLGGSLPEDLDDEDDDDETSDAVTDDMQQSEKRAH